MIAPSCRKKGHKEFVPIELAQIENAYLFLENMGVLRGYTLIIYKEVSYFFMLLFMMIFFAASEIKVEETNALCKQTSAYGDSFPHHHRLMFYFIC